MGFDLNFKGRISHSLLFLSSLNIKVCGNRILSLQIDLMTNSGGITLAKECRLSSKFFFILYIYKKSMSNHIVKRVDNIYVDMDRIILRIGGNVYNFHAL